MRQHSEAPPRPSLKILAGLAAFVPVVAVMGLAAPPASAATTATASVMPAAVSYGDTVTYTMDVSASPGPATGGQVTFTTGNTFLCSPSGGLVNGTASCTASNAPGGVDSIEAIYVGVFGNSSATTTLTVNVTPPAAPAGSTGSSSAAGTDPAGAVSAHVGSLYLQGNGPGAVTVATYGANPTPTALPSATGVYGDVAIGRGSSFDSVVIAQCDYGAASSLQWYDGATSSWAEFSLQSKDVGCLRAEVSGTTTPTLAQLVGTPIALSAETAPMAPQGYWLAARDGGIFSFHRSFYGSTGSIRLNQPIVGMAPSHDDGGYWLAAADGGVFGFGDAGYQGSLPNRGIRSDKVVAIVGDPATNGYDLIGSDGSVWDFNTPQFGDLPFFGFHVNNIVGAALTPDAKGLYLVGADGRVYGLLGDSKFQGDASGLPLNAPIVGMAVDPATGGYWLVGKDGGVFSYNAPFHGSTGSLTLNQPVIGMASTGDGGGYWFTAGDGGVFAYGDASFWGSTGSIVLNQPVVGMSGS